MPILAGVITAIVSLLIGFVGRLFYERLRNPELVIESRLVGPFPIGGGSLGDQYLGYRIRIRNREKELLNTAAENCLVWLEVIDPAPEEQFYQLAWVPGKDSITINVDDIGQVEFCAVKVGNPDSIYFPTERGWFVPEPREFHLQNLKARIKVTCKNGPSAEKMVNLTYQNDRICTVFENS